MSDFNVNDGILFIHGFTGTPLHFKHLSDYFESKGYVVNSLLLTGHGTSLEDMIGVTYDIWINDVIKAYDELKKRVQKVHFVGLSMGTMLSIMTSLKHDVASQTLISPPIFMKNKLIYMISFLKYFKKSIKWNKDWISSIDPELAKYNQEYEGFYTESAHELYKIVKLAKGNLHNVKTPTLTIISKKDELVELKGGDYIMNNINSDIKKLIVLEDAVHVSTLSNERHIIQAKIEQFIDNIKK